MTVDDEKTIEALNGARELTDKTVSMTGAAVNTAVAMERTDEEIQKIVLLIIPLCFVILVLTTTSWFEPVLVYGNNWSCNFVKSRNESNIWGNLICYECGRKYSPISCLDGLLYFPITSICRLSENG